MGNVVAVVGSIYLGIACTLHFRADCFAFIASRVVTSGIYIDCFHMQNQIKFLSLALSPSALNVTARYQGRDIPSEDFFRFLQLKYSGRIR